MAKTWPAEKLLAHVLEGGEVSTEILKVVLKERVSEGQLLDFKHGNLLEKKDDASQVVREYVAGFANADGGILIIGVAEPEEKGGEREVTGCTDKLGPLDEWATRALTNLVAHLSPMPRVKLVVHENGIVLVVAVSRAPNLVPVVSKSRVTYFLRMGDQTLATPESVVADLFLGRRARPQLRLSAQFTNYNRDMNANAGNLQVQIDIANDGLMLIPPMVVYLVGYFAQGKSWGKPSPALMRYIDAPPEQKQFPGAELGLRPFRIDNSIDPLSHTTGLAMFLDVYAEHNYTIVGELWRSRSLETAHRRFCSWTFYYRDSGGKKSSGSSSCDRTKSESSGLLTATPSISATETVERVRVHESGAFGLRAFRHARRDRPLGVVCLGQHDAARAAVVLENPADSQGGDRRSDHAREHLAEQGDRQQRVPLVQLEGGDERQEHRARRAREMGRHEHEPRYNLEEHPKVVSLTRSFGL